MDGETVKILLVEDDEDDFILTRSLLADIKRVRYQVDWVADYDTALDNLRKREHDVALIDYRLGTRTGLELLQEAVASRCSLPLILLTGQGDQTVDLQAMEAGAADYLVKGEINAPLLERSIRYAIGHARTLDVLRQAVQENSLLASSISHLTNGVVITDAKKPHNPIIFINPAFTRMTGYSQEEVIGRPFDFLQGTLTGQAETRGIEEAIHSGRSASAVVLHYRKDGSTFWNELIVNPIFNPEGEVVNFVLLQNDVTERKRAEEMRLAKEAAEEGSRAKSEFLTKISHELRTPLNSVIGFTNILLKNKWSRLGEEELSYLRRILGNGKHLLDLINDILDLSKIEAGRIELELERVQVDELVEETIGQMEDQPREHVRLFARVDKPVAPIETDAAKLKQILINLIGNGLKFTERGHVLVEVEVEPHSRRPTHIHVVDTGLGIPPDQIGKIMEPFHQARRTRSQKYGGTGLGLTICRSLCQLMGYHLEVASNPGEGSRFTIVLQERMHCSWNSREPDPAREGVC